MSSMRRRVASDQLGNDVVVQIARHGELTAVQRGIPEPMNPVRGRQLQCDEVAAGAADNDFAVIDFHTHEQDMTGTGTPSGVTVT